MHPALFVNAVWEKGEGKFFETSNPSNGTLLWSGRAVSFAQIHKAVAAASAAFFSWADLPLTRRIEFLKNFASGLQERAASLMECISLETGKPLWESKQELLSMIQKVALSIEAYEERCPKVKKSHAQGMSVTRRRPHGPVVVLGPYNFPGHLPHGHIIPALLAGNTILFKPSEKTPLVAEELTKLWHAIGLPPGVFNLLQGGREVGECLAMHPEVKGIFFTGSSAGGIALSTLCAAEPQKILALEMGGNNPLIVGNSPDSQAAAYAAILSAYLSSGQRCTCARRLIVINTPYARPFLDAFLKMAKKIVVGRFQDLPEPFMGPVISTSHAAESLQTQEKWLQSGGSSLLKMHLLKGEGAFLSPGLIDVTSIPAREDSEIFAPLLQLIQVDTLEDAMREANNTRFGLSAGILTDEEAEYTFFYKHIRAGIVNWNTPLTGASSAAPFGGIGLSGNHRPSGFYAADYCSYPVASLEAQHVAIPEKTAPGIDTHAS